MCSGRSLKLSLGIATFYLGWILLCSHFNGIFPYPFLNKLPWPQARSRHMQFTWLLCAVGAQQGSVSL